MSYSDFVMSRFKNGASTIQDILTSPAAHIELLHTAIGMMGEWIEILNANDRENLQEELGDFWFYYVAATRVTFTGISENSEGFAEPMRLADVQTSMLAHLGDLLDQSKKLSIYAKPLDAETTFVVRCILQRIASCFHTVIRTMGFTLKELEAHNEAKLTKRYPKKYSNLDAQNRADKK